MTSSSLPPRYKSLSLLLLSSIFSLSLLPLSISLSSSLFLSLFLCPKCLVGSFIFLSVQNMKEHKMNANQWHENQWKVSKVLMLTVDKNTIAIIPLKNWNYHLFSSFFHSSFHSLSLHSHFVLITNYDIDSIEWQTQLLRDGYRKRTKLKEKEDGSMNYEFWCFGTLLTNYEESSLFASSSLSVILLFFLSSSLSFSLPLVKKGKMLVGCEETSKQHFV